MNNRLTIKTAVEPDIDSDLDAAICRLQREAFPQQPLFETSRHYVHKPRQGDLRVLAFDGERLVGQVVAYQAAGRCGDATLSLACLGNICCDADYRGRGVASECLTVALDHARWADRQWAMLFCRGRLTEFYGRFGFAEIAKKLNVTTAAGDVVAYPKDDIAMVLPLAEDQQPSWPRETVTLDIDVF